MLPKLAPKLINYTNKPKHTLTPYSRSFTWISGPSLSINSASLSTTLRPLILGQFLRLTLNQVQTNIWPLQLKQLKHGLNISVASFKILFYRLFGLYSSSPGLTVVAPHSDDHETHGACQAQPLQTWLHHLGYWRKPFLTNHFADDSIIAPIEDNHLLLSHLRDDSIIVSTDDNHLLL